MNLILPFATKDLLATNMYLIKIKAEFIGYHRYKGAPANVSFLRNYHRHLFCIELQMEVTKGNRQIEFFTVQRQLYKFLDKHYREKKFEKSCEQIAQHIAENFNAYSVEVSEDDECSGIYVRD